MLLDAGSLKARNRAPAFLILDVSAVASEISIDLGPSRGAAQGGGSVLRSTEDCVCVCVCARERERERDTVYSVHPEPETSALRFGPSATVMDMKTAMAMSTETALRRQTRAPGSVDSPVPTPYSVGLLACKGTRSFSKPPCRRRSASQTQGLQHSSDCWTQAQPARAGSALEPRIGIGICNRGSRGCAGARVQRTGAPIPKRNSETSRYPDYGTAGERNIAWALSVSIGPKLSLLGPVLGRWVMSDGDE